MDPKFLGNSIQNFRSTSRRASPVRNTFLPFPVPYQRKSRGNENEAPSLSVYGKLLNYKNYYCRGRCILVLRNFCAVYEYEEKQLLAGTVGIQTENWGEPRIIFQRQSSNSNSKTLRNTHQGVAFSLRTVRKMRAYPNFFWIATTLYIKICFPRIVINHVEISLKRYKFQLRP